MKCNLLRRILVGILTLTTVCSGLGTTVVYAVDGDVPPAIVYESGDSIFEPVSEGEEQVEEEQTQDDTVETVDESESDSESDGEETAAEDNSEASEGSETGDVDDTDESGEQESDAGAEDVTAETGSESGDESDLETSEEAVYESSEEEATTEDSAAETSSEEDIEEAATEDSAAEASSEDKKAAKIPEVKVPKADTVKTAATGMVTDLSNPEFGIIEKITLPESVDNIGEKITLGFDFFIKNALTIPDGKFTYTLPDSLDFSMAEGKEIPVYEDGVKIGTATVGSDRVIYFQLDTAVLEKKPNGIHGSVGLTCKIRDNSTDGGEKVRIRFSETVEVEVEVKNPAISASKGNAKISNGIALWCVVFDVHTDTDGFVITDTLGSNLVFTGKYSLNSGNSVLPVKAQFLDDHHTIKLDVGHIAAGKYKLYYQVKPLASLSTEGLSDEEIIAAGNGNTCYWTWDGATKEHEVTGYATQTESTWLSKYAGNKDAVGKVTPEGVASWQVYINGGSLPNNLAGYTFVDELDERMEFSDFNVQLRISTDGQTWKEYKTLDESYFEYNEATGKWTLKIHFDENTPVAYYSLLYNTKVKELPSGKTTYTNRAAIYKDTELISEVYRDAEYAYSGVYTATISKGITQQRNDETGVVDWQANFTVSGDKGTYSVLITDKIAPAAGNEVINGKTVGARIVPKSVKVYKSDSSGNPVGKALTNLKIVVSPADTYTIVANDIEAGTYCIQYQTQDYYGSKDVHTYPSGSTVTFNNHIELKIDKTVIPFDAAYDVESQGLPMRKSSVEGHYDSATDEYIIPWTITVNENEFFQSNAAIAAGTEAVVTDLLPENLSYKAGSAQLERLDGSIIGNINAMTSMQDGREKVEWKFSWPDGLTDGNACVIRFETVVDKAYLNNLVVNSTDGAVTISFSNSATATVGGSTGVSNATSVDTLGIIDKSASVDSENQLLNYAIVVNDKAIDLIDGDEIKLTDDITNGTLVAGSLHVYDYSGRVKGAEITLGAGKVVTRNKNRSFEITIPDERALLIEYQVMADVSKGEAAGNGQTTVAVSNKATLYGEGTKSDVVEDKYTFDEVQANITSESGEIKITKVETGNVLTGLAGAKFGLYRVNLGTGAVTTVATKDTTAPDYSITFSEDGKYDSLIFDTLYYYQEIKAPANYQLDATKHYVVFKGRNYSSVEDKIKQYLSGIKDVDFQVVDVLNGEAAVDAIVENSRKKDTPDDPGRKDDTPDKPKTPDTPNTPDGPTQETTENTTEESSVVTVTSTTTTVSGTNVTLLDLPEVLGASRNPDDLPEVLGARRSNTSDRDMTGAFGGMIMAFMVLAVAVPGKKKKEDRI